MAEFSRVTPEGWEHGDDSTTFTRVEPQGWQHFEAAAAPGGFIAAWAAASQQSSRVIGGGLGT